MAGGLCVAGVGRMVHDDSGKLVRPRVIGDAGLAIPRRRLLQADGFRQGGRQGAWEGAPSDQAERKPNPRDGTNGILREKVLHKNNGRT